MVTEGSVICHLPQDEILDALIGLLGSFYIFNVSYNQSKAILTFLEQALLEIRQVESCHCFLRFQCLGKCLR